MWILQTLNSIKEFTKKLPTQHLYVSGSVAGAGGTELMLACTESGSVEHPFLKFFVLYYIFLFYCSQVFSKILLNITTCSQGFIPVGS